MEILLRFYRFGDPFALLFYKTANEAVRAMKGIEDTPEKLVLHGEEMGIRFEGMRKGRGARNRNAGRKGKGKGGNKKRN